MITLPYLFFLEMLFYFLFWLFLVILEVFCANGFSLKKSAGGAGGGGQHRGQAGGHHDPVRNPHSSIPLSLASAWMDASLITQAMDCSTSELNGR